MMSQGQESVKQQNYYAQKHTPTDNNKCISLRQIPLWLCMCEAQSAIHETLEQYAT